MLSEKPWRLERVILFLLGVLLCFSCISLALGLVLHWQGITTPRPDSLLSALLQMSLHISVLGATVFVLWWDKLSWGEAFGFSRNGAGQAVVLGILATVIFLPIAWVLEDSVLQIAHWRHPEKPPPQVQEAVHQLQETHALDRRVALVLLAVLIAPVAEEILFRGILYPAIKRLGAPRLAWWVSAIIFAAMHQSWPVFIPLMAMGLMLIWLYEKTNNLLAPIAAHSAFNAINLFKLFYDQYAAQHGHG